jgi:hypothetical protein
MGCLRQRVYYAGKPGMPQGGSFLPVHSGLGMDVKSVSHLYKESQSLDIVRALIQGDHTV